MSQNRSHAVMAQRVEPHDSLDFFPTPAWGTRALCEWIAEEQGESHLKANLTAWEPACGQGHMARALGEYFSGVLSSDIFDYGFPRALRVDFLFSAEPTPPFDWIITNPPFLLAERFALKALEMASYGVALLIRTSFLESKTRYESLFSVSPPTDILQFVERLPMVKGRVDREATTATAYCWLVWRKNHMRKHGTVFRWIPPCRKRLEREGDYE
jgi:hypothetical protein